MQCRAHRCTADCGWITGHSYLTYGPLLNGVTNVVFEGTPTHPTPARCWEVVAKYKARGCANFRGVTRHKDKATL
jgi:acyl-coenzyme A synthetase/AMP-(fatty) acid ligase